MREERNLVFLAQNKGPPFGCYMCNSGIVALECATPGFLKSHVPAPKSGADATERL
jgi:hypothetical protein